MEIKFIGTEEAARILDRSEVRVRQLAAQKRIKSYRHSPGTAHIFIRSEIEAFAKIPRKVGNPGMKGK